jgi:hypothetical protein
MGKKAGRLVLVWICAWCAPAAFHVRAGTEVIVNERFAGGMHETQNPPGSLAWFGSAQGVVKNWGKSLRLLARGEQPRQVAAHFPRATLAGGELLLFAFDFELRMPPGDHDGGFRFGLFDSGGLSGNRIDREGKDAAVASPGCAVFVNLRDSKNRTTMALYQRDGRGSLLNDPGKFHRRLASRGMLPAPLSVNRRYHVEMTFRPLAGGLLEIAVEFSGGGLPQALTQTARIAGGAAASYDTVGFSIVKSGVGVVNLYDISIIKESDRLPAGQMNVAPGEPATARDGEMPPMPAAYSPEPPLRWAPPPSFDPDMPGLGLPQLPGVHTEIIYAPTLSTAAREDGGDGRYESLAHGTYNHHTRAIIYKDKVIVYWTNHARDENGPGQRILARWGTFNHDRSRVDWGTPETNLVEIAPPPVDVRRREPLDQPKDRRYVGGRLLVVDGKIRLAGAVAMYHGWTDDLKYRTPSTPLPEERFREVRDRTTGYNYDMRWATGPAFYQTWDFVAGKLAPVSPMFLDRRPECYIQLTPKKRFMLEELNEPYQSAPLLDSLSAGRRKFFVKQVELPGSTKSRVDYAPHTRHLAANGKNGLAHMAQYQRRDGTCVIIRDNLNDRGTYYAAESVAGGVYPPAAKTNLYGDAMPAAGELPDGTNWILGNSRGRYDFFVTLSRDGRVFDRTWAICHESSYWESGLYKPATSGPQYPYALPIGGAIWVFYSIGKEQIAVLRIPHSSLHMKERRVAVGSDLSWRATRPEAVMHKASSMTLAAAAGPLAVWAPLPDVMLENEGDGVRFRFQFICLRSPVAGGAPFISGLLREADGGGTGLTASLDPLSPSGRASVTLSRQDARLSGGMRELARNEGFHRKIARGKKYDAEMILMRQGGLLSSSVRIFGGDLPSPVVASAKESQMEAFVCNQIAFVLGGGGIPEIEISQIEITAFHIPREGAISGTDGAYEAAGTAQTSNVYDMMDD